MLSLVLNHATRNPREKSPADQKGMRPMSNYDQNAAAPGFSANGATAIDVGLRAFMLRVYNYMAAGVGLTGVTAFLTYQFTGPELLQSPLMWVFMLAPLGLVFFISARINTLSVEAARGFFSSMRPLSGFHCRRCCTSTRSPRSRGCSLSRRRPSVRSAFGVILPSETCRDSELSSSWA